jgi:hypothetical protein
MVLTRDFKETVKKRAIRDPTFAGNRLHGANVWTTPTPQGKLTVGNSEQVICSHVYGLVVRSCDRGAPMKSAEQFPISGTRSKRHPLCGFCRSVRQRFQA